MTETALPYAGTSGHSGTDTSRERAVQADSSGKTNERQRWVLKRLDLLTTNGATVKDIRNGAQWHHGVASSVLTTLHIAGRIVRLAEKRDRCHVYVLPQYVHGREVSLYTPNKRNRVEVDVDQIEEEAFARGMQAAMEDPSHAWASEAGHDADKVLAEVEQYLNGAYATAWGVRAILTKHREQSREQADG